ncbi:MAG: ABC transporter ATP-binding protein [Eubacteriales bacterium]
MLFGDCVIIVQNIVTTAGSIQGVVNGFMQLHNNSLSVRNIRAFLEYKPEIAEDVGGQGTPEDECCLSIDNVSFTYPNSDRTVLGGINLSIKSGEKIALVGHNGAGKSTLVKLLLRLYDPTDGEIKLNDINIKKYRLSSYRSLFATVFQKYRIFSISILENILLRGNLTSEDKKRADSAMRDSGVYEKTTSLKNGIDTVLTKEFDQEGAVLSGGEYQKIALARVFVRPSKIVILDEPSSALDPIAEYRMYEAMMKACENKSVVYISHRLSSSVLADRVYMLENGKIVENGSHSQLLNLNGKYADMWRKQSEQYRKGVAVDA